MWKWIVLSLILAVFLVCILLSVQRRKYERELAAVSEILAGIINGSVPQICTENDDVILSKIQHQAGRLDNMTKSCREAAARDREDIRKLITEIAHQLRTPLTNMKTYLELSKEPLLEENERQKYLAAIQVSEEKISFLTESFIKMSRLEHQIIQIHSEPTDLVWTILCAAEQVREKAREKKLKLVMQCPKELMVEHDSRWLGEAIYNLLDNAVKYSYEGKTVEIGAEKNEMYTRVWVRDYGCGIEKGEENEIFKRFYRGKNAAGKEGFGIGLYLAREITAKQGGFMRVKRMEKGMLAEMYV